MYLKSNFKKLSMQGDHSEARDQIHITCFDGLWEVIPAAAAHVSLPADGLAYLRDSCATLSALTTAHPSIAETLLSHAHAILTTLIRVHSRLLPSAVGVWSRVRDQSSKKHLAQQVFPNICFLQFTKSSFFSVFSIAGFKAGYISKRHWECTLIYITVIVFACRAIYPR